MPQHFGYNYEEADHLIVLFEDEGDSASALGDAFKRTFDQWKPLKFRLHIYDGQDDWLEAANSETKDSHRTLWLVDLLTKGTQPKAANAVDTLLEECKLRDRYYANSFAAIRNQGELGGLAVALIAFREKIPFRYTSKYTHQEKSTASDQTFLLGYLASLGTENQLGSEFFVSKEELSAFSERIYASAWKSVAELAGMSGRRRVDFALLVGPANELRWTREELRYMGWEVSSHSFAAGQCFRVSPPGKAIIGVLCATRTMGLISMALLTQAVLQHFRPWTLVGLGYAATMKSEDYKIGDVVVGTHVDHYLENAKAIPVEKLDGCGCAGFSLELSGEEIKLDDALNELVLDLDHYESAYSDFCGRTAELSKSAIEKQVATRAGFSNLSNNIDWSDYVAKEPSIRGGIIASGFIVGAALEFSQFLHSKRNRKYAALEMETWGLAAACHYEKRSKHKPEMTLILQGISDYADNKKNTVSDEQALQMLATKAAVQAFCASVKAGFLRSVPPGEK